MTKAEFIVQCVAAVLGNTQGQERLDLMPKAEQVCEQQAANQQFTNPNTPEQMAQENIKNATDAAAMLGVGWGMWKVMEAIVKD